MNVESLNNQGSDDFRRENGYGFSQSFESYCENRNIAWYVCEVSYLCRTVIGGFQTVFTAPSPVVHPPQPSSHAQPSMVRATLSHFREARSTLGEKEIRRPTYSRSFTERARMGGA